MGDTSQFEKARNMLRIIVDVSILDYHDLSRHLIHIRHLVSSDFSNRTSPCLTRVLGYHEETWGTPRLYTNDGCRLLTQSP